jgi:hypothetical protein
VIGKFSPERYKRECVDLKWEASDGGRSTKREFLERRLRRRK